MSSELSIADRLNSVEASLSAASAYSGQFMGLPIPEDENLWTLSPVSPTMGTGAWDKADTAALCTSALERDLKNAQVRNGQPTPPPYEDQHLHESSSFVLDTASRRRRARECQMAADSLSPDLDDSPQLERAKRAKFLERNRLAASKCRQKKKEHTQQLESRYKEQSEKKEQLVGEIARLRSEILNLKNEVLKHAQCGDEPIKLHLAQMVKKITDTDGPAPRSLSAADSSIELMDGSISPEDTALTPTPTTGAQPVTSALSFGFDDSLEPASAAVAQALEQEMREEELRRNSSASMLSESSYAFSADDPFEDLINV
ncbi:Rho GTPase activation protein [Penicillium chermesinum]|nr:Rho GTPase activation protein [Penicillium chermesinum]